MLAYMDLDSGRSSGTRQGRGDGQKSRGRLEHDGGGRSRAGAGTRGGANSRSGSSSRSGTNSRSASSSRSSSSSRTGANPRSDTTPRGGASARSASSSRASANPRSASTPRSGSRRSDSGRTEDRGPSRYPSQSDGYRGDRTSSWAGRPAASSDQRGRAPGSATRNDARRGAFVSGDDDGRRRRYPTGDDRRSRADGRTQRSTGAGWSSGRAPSRAQRGDAGSRAQTWSPRGPDAPGRGDRSAPRRPTDGPAGTRAQATRGRGNDAAFGRQAREPGPQWGRSRDPSARGSSQGNFERKPFEERGGYSAEHPAPGQYGRRPSENQPRGARSFSGGSSNLGAGGNDSRERNSFRSGAPRRDIDGAPRGARDRRSSTRAVTVQRACLRWRPCLWRQAAYGDRAYGDKRAYGGDRAYGDKR